MVEDVKFAGNAIDAALQEADRNLEEGLHKLLELIAIPPFRAILQASKGLTMRRAGLRMNLRSSALRRGLSKPKVTHWCLPVQPARLSKKLRECCFTGITMCSRLASRRRETCTFRAGDYRGRRASPLLWPWRIG